MPLYGLKLDDDGDIPLVPSFLTGPELTCQRAAIRLQTFYGEWILDQFVGMPFIAWRARKPPDVNAMINATLVELSGVPGVIRVPEIDGAFDPSTRIVTITGTVVVEDVEEVDEATLYFVSVIGGNTTPAVVMFSRSAAIARP